MLLPNMRKATMITRSFFSIILLSVFTLGNAQTDSIKNEIENSTTTKSVLISKGRSLLLDKFLSGDIKKTSEIQHYLSDNLSDDNYIALYPIEEWLIDFWTRDYVKLIKGVRQFDSISLTLQRKIHPATDDLYTMLKEKTNQHRQILINSIKSSSMSVTDIDFLIMHLNGCILNRRLDHLAQDTLNGLADKFISTYPENTLIDFTRKYIRYKFVPSDWSFDFEFFSGFGLFSGNLKNNFANNIPFGVAFDVYYKKVVFYLRDYIGFSFTKHDFTSSNVIWNKNSQVRVFLPEASAGYIIHDSYHLKLAPFAGISSTDITPTDYDLQNNPGLKDYELKFTTTYTVGFNVDFKFGKARYLPIKKSTEQNYWFVRIRYAYNFPQFSKSYPGFNGNMQYITIGIGGFERRIKRVK